VTARRRRSRDGAIRVATFNIRHGATVDDLVRPVALARACAELDPDVLGLQEVERGNRRSWYVDQGRFVAAYLRARYAAGPAVRRSRWRTYGNGLVARGRIRDVAVVDLPRGPEREPRSAVLAVVTVGEVRISVAVTHLQHRPARLRHLPSDGARQLSAVLDALRARPSPRLLLGDLNLQPPAAQPILESAGFTVAEHGPTYPADVPRIRLDYVAVDGLRVGDVRVAGHASVSDHRAVVADLVP
jgi:endonuclease/exonuclease/phosphatase family metal-dependent hydrolase